MGIHRDLLVHTVTYRPKSTDDFLGSGYGEPQTVQNVRLDWQSRVVKTARGEDAETQAVLFVNGSTSINWQEGDKVTFDGHDMTVRAVARYYARNAEVHHLEVMLV